MRCENGWLLASISNDIRPFIRQPSPAQPILASIHPSIHNSLSARTPARTPTVLRKHRRIVIRIGHVLERRTAIGADVQQRARARSGVELRDHTAIIVVASDGAAGQSRRVVRHGDGSAERRPDVAVGVVRAAERASAGGAAGGACGCWLEGDGCGFCEGGCCGGLRVCQYVRGDDGESSCMGGERFIGGGCHSRCQSRHW